MTYYKDEIKKFFKGECLDTDEIIEKYSHDASLLKVVPKLVVFPKDVSDIKNLVNFVGQKKKDDQGISITARAAGTCMSGGSINESIIMDVNKYINGGIDIDKEKRVATVLPGTFYRDFEKETLKHNLIFPSFTASKNICAIGGMIGNNAGGEKTLAYGKTEKYIEELKVVFSDGNEYSVKPLNKDELENKMNQGDFEGNIYKRIFNLIKENKDIIDKAKPNVSKNSAGYYLWNVWDKDKFDLNRLLVGSQGTLGLVTEVKLKLVPVKKYSKLFVIFMKDLENLSLSVNEILKFKPESLESYDNYTMKLAFRFLPGIIKSMKVKNFLKLTLSFIPEFFMILFGGLPKLILLVEFSGDSESEIDKKMKDLDQAIKKFKFKTRITKSLEESEKYWTIRRESFSLLREHVKGKRTAPFIDDIAVSPDCLPEFLPKLNKILDEYKLTYTIAGHVGDGNFHIIPLMDMKKEGDGDMIIEISDRVYDLVFSYNGTITGEHNDGIIRTPYLEEMYGSKIYSLFKEVKSIFDPQNIFNPGKKIGGSKDYIKSHIDRG